MKEIRYIQGVDTGCVKNATACGANEGIYSARLDVPPINILVTGSQGILATALRAHFPEASYRSRESCDVSNRIGLNAVFQEVKPQLVLHCGAATAHNATPMAYMEANIVGTANIVRQCARWNARLIYPSTDYLGAKHEDDPVKPVNDYAASKLGGELCVRMLPNSLIVRGSWYDRLEYDKAATDMYTSKIPVARAAGWIAELALSSYTGIINIGYPSRSMYDIIRQEFNPDVRPCLRSEVECGYELPADTSLATDRHHEIWPQLQAARFQARGLV